MTEPERLIPFEQIADEAWQRLALAANDVHHPMRLMTLANVDAAGLPTARLMVLRGADRTSGRVWFHTDRFSGKVSQFRHHPNACAVVYDFEAGIQLRLYGRISLHERDAVADSHWQQLMMSMRHAYGAPDSPVQPLPASDPRLARLWRHQHTTKMGQDRSRFTVIEMQVSRLVWQEFEASDQRVATLYASDNWQPHPESGTTQREDRT